MNFSSVAIVVCLFLVDREHSPDTEDRSGEEQELRNEIQDRVMYLSRRRCYEASDAEAHSRYERKDGYGDLDFGYSVHVAKNMVYFMSFEIIRMIITFAL